MRKLLRNLALFSALLSISGCAEGADSSLGPVVFEEALCIAGTMGLGPTPSDTQMQISGYVEVPDINIDEIKLEVIDSSLDFESTWGQIESDFTVSADNKAYFSLNPVDYQQWHDPWNFKIRAVSRENTENEWIEYSFKCPNGEWFDNS